MSKEVMEGEVADVEAVATEVEIAFKVSVDEERRVKVRFGTVITTVLEVFARERSCPVEELIVIREGEEVELDLGTVIEPGYPHHRRHHVHHKSALEVVVNYNMGTHEKKFRRRATIDDVLTWAIPAFGIDPAMASEFELARHGETTELPGTDHLGHLAHHHHKLELDLVRGALVNGAA